MSLPSSPGGQPTLLEYFERSELRPSMPGATSTAEDEVLCSADDCKVRPLFHGLRSESSATHSATQPSDGQSLYPDVETPGSSIWDAEESNSKLAGQLVESIDAHIEDTERQSQGGIVASSLADLMIAEIAAEIEALGSEDGNGDEDATNVGEFGYEVEAPGPTLSDAKARIQLFEESSEYASYARDRAFHDQISRWHPYFPLVRVEGRMKAFEGTEAWCRYLEALQVVVVSHEIIPEVQTGAARQAGDMDVQESAVMESGFKRADGACGDSKERVKGQLSKQWRELGLEIRPVSSIRSPHAW